MIFSKVFGSLSKCGVTKMIRGDSHWDVTFWHTKSYKTRRGHSAAMIPTIDEVLDFQEPFNRDLVKQITSGQGLYFGPEVDSYVDNSVNLFLNIRQEVPKSQKRYRPIIENPVKTLPVALRGLHRSLYRNLRLAHPEWSKIRASKMAVDLLTK